MLGNELQRAVEKTYGKGTDLRVVHPMDTYINGRNKGFYVGILVALAGFLLHEIHFHDWHNMDVWSVLLLAGALLIAFWAAYKSEPNKIATDVRESLDIYKDEK
jgi:hypothetical protein